MTMFVPLRTAQSDLWDGGRSGMAGALEIFHADEVRDRLHPSSLPAGAT